MAILRPLCPALRLPVLQPILRSMLGALVLASPLLQPLPATAQDPPPDSARFIVSDTVAAPDLAPFDATVEELGNGARLTGAGGGFEPAVFRTRITPTVAARNRIIAEPKTISGYDSWREGAFDGADVEVLRIVNGKFTTVRRDHVAQGGFHASGWELALGNKVLAPDQHQVQLSWDNYNRAGAPYYYTVRAVDSSGALSPEATAVSVISPAKPGRRDASAAPRLSDLKPGTGRSRLAAPKGLAARMLLDRTMLLSWQPVPGAAGYVIYRSDYPPEKQTGYYIELAGDGPGIEPGDMVLLRARYDAPDRARLLSNRIWDVYSYRAQFVPGVVPVWANEPNSPHWELRAHAPDSPVPEGGKTYLHATLDPGQKLELGRYNHAGTAQDWYPVLDPAKSYTFEVWLRGSGQISASFQLRGPLGRSKIQGLPARFTLGPQWQRQTVTFRVPELYDGKNPGQMLLTLSGQGTVDVDNFRIYRADAPYMALLPEQIAELRQSGMGDLRTHAFVRTRANTYDLEELTNPAGAISSGTGETLPQTLAAIHSAGMNPWLQIEPHLSREEWLGLAEYLAAPFDPAHDDAKAHPWAAKRVAQGQRAPYTEMFDHIRLEIGNETWNSLFRPWTFPAMTDGASGKSYDPGAVYGLYEDYVLSILRQSPYWDQLSAKLVPVIGGWLINNYGFSAGARTSGGPIDLTHAEYIGGWDQGEGPVRPVPEGYASVLGFGVQAAEPRAKALVAKARALARQRGSAVAIGTYESGPGYAKNGLNGERVSAEQMAGQEKVMKSVAAGTATLDTFLLQAQAGYTIQNYFTFGTGREWTSHAPWFRGGQAFPGWQWLAFVNARAGGDMLAVRTLDTPRRDLAKYKLRPERRGAPMVGAFAIRNGDRVTLFVVSRQVPGLPGSPGGALDGHSRVQITLPFRHAGALTRYQMNAPYDTDNIDGPNAMLQGEPMAVPASLPELEIPDLPPGQAIAYEFSATGN